MSRTKTITVVVSEDLDPATVSSRTVFIKLRGASQKIKATVSYDPGRELIRINPAKKLGAQSTYRVTVTPGVHDLAGNRFDGNTSRSGFQNLRWTFTTD